MDLFNRSDVFDHLLFRMIYNDSYNHQNQFIQLYILELYNLYPYFSWIKCSFEALK